MVYVEEPDARHVGVPTVEDARTRTALSAPENTALPVTQTVTVV